jgi:hypothetical protein
MPELFWNMGAQDKKKGLDVLGLRGVDQELERRWVAGITTISFRARYLSMLAWLCAEVFERSLAKGGSDALFDKDEFERVLRRFEAVVFFSTNVGRTAGERGATFGVLNSDLLQAEANQLDAGGTIEVPSTKGGGVVGTYFMPARSLGLIDWPGSSSRLPLSIPPRGNAIWAARREIVNSSKLTNVIFEGGEISRGDLETDGRHFSVNRIDSVPRELALLRSAFLEPHDDADLGAFERLQRTIEWSLAGLEDASGATSDALIREAFASVVRQPQTSRPEVEFVWCEYELYRRTHFACELLLSALVQSVDEASASAATLPDVIASWLRQSALPSLIEERFRWQRWPEVPIGEIDIDVTTYVDEALPARDVAKWPAEAAAAFAVGLLFLVVNQGRLLLRDGRLAVQGSPFSHLVQMVETHDGGTLAEFLEKLLGTWLVPQHIHNALRKMASGGPCTLRFFTEGDQLCTTGIAVVPGYSGDRLSNVLRMLSDIGYAERVSGSIFRANEAGQALLAERRVTA